MAQRHDGLRPQRVRVGRQEPPPAAMRVHAGHVADVEPGGLEPGDGRQVHAERRVHAAQVTHHQRRVERHLVGPNCGVGPPPGEVEAVPGIGRHAVHVGALVVVVGPPRDVRHLGDESAPLSRRGAHDEEHERRRRLHKGLARHRGSVACRGIQPSGAQRVAEPAGPAGGVGVRSARAPHDAAGGRSLVVVVCVGELRGGRRLRVVDPPRRRHGPPRRGDARRLLPPGRREHKARSEQARHRPARHAPPQRLLPHATVHQQRGLVAQARGLGRGCVQRGGAGLDRCDAPRAHAAIVPEPPHVRAQRVAVESPVGRPVERVCEQLRPNPDANAH
mmetsp:Transcript_292/g.934  ORF Transcript_292/g.934 Transcript_292/m.934 type:complete len:333 (+) Transcript_292:1657-2655(+)